MPLSHSSPLASALPQAAGGVSRTWDRRVLVVGVAAALAVIGLAFAAPLGRGWSLVAALAVFGLALLLAYGRRAASVGEARGQVPAGAGDGDTYAVALELAPNPVLIVAGEEPDDIASRRVLFANAEARELLRIAREGALLVSAVRHPGVLEAIDEALFGGLSRTLNYETGGPQTRFWRVWAKPLPSGSTDGRLALVILRDETDVRMNERMRADFLANASHELRTPLASLTGFIDTLRGHARDDEAARDRFLAIMSRQAERMARLIDDLLSLSRIELSEHIRPAGTCDLALAVHDVVDALAPQIEAREVTTSLDLPAPGLADVTGERDQIVQVVQNLLDNAVKYAPPGGTVRVSVTPGLTLEAASAPSAGDPRLSAENGGRMSLLTPTRLDAARYVLVRIDDAGPGMKREHLPRLTERFYRVEGQKSGERLGTGLGLAIVKHIVNRHRGGFFVESAPGMGASFGVYLPMTKRAAGALPAAVAALEPANAA